jgi:DNA-binding IclR family transcriptional regulator
MQTTLARDLLILVFRAAQTGRRPNLTAFCRRSGVGAATLQRAFDELEQRALLSFTPAGERLTLQGLAVAVALARHARPRQRPLAACRPIAA